MAVGGRAGGVGARGGWLLYVAVEGLSKEVAFS